MTLEHATLSHLEIDPSYGPLKGHLIESTGLAYYADKDRELTLLVGRRMATLNIGDCGEYLNLLLDGPAGAAELDRLAEGLTIGETFFFRHQEVFDAVRDSILPEIIRRNREQRRLRIWSAGCATGAEPYSLAILLRREFANQLADWDVTILGTDINRDFLAQGRRGEFTDWAFRSAPDELKEACFLRSGPTWAIREEFRRGVLFQYHNLVQHPIPSLINNLSAFDLILCRNVMIYFEPAIVRRLVGQFHDCLVEGGWLVVGPTEPSVELFRAFQTVNAPGAVLYRKTQPAPAPAPAPRAVAPIVHPPAVARPLADAAGRLADGRIDTTPPGRRQPAARRRHPGRGQAATPTVAKAATPADARALLNGGRSDEAAACCRGLIAADPLNPCVHYYDALVAEQQGRSDEVESALRRAVYLDRDFILAHYHLGLVLLRKPDGEAAGRSFRNVLAVLDRRLASETIPDADGLTVDAMRQLTNMQLEILNRT